MTYDGFIRHVLGRLDAAGIAYMVSGSIASSYLGEPRSTNDIDIVIDPSPQALEALIDAFVQDDLYVSRDAARSEFARRGMFNVVDVEGGWKADLIFRKARPFSVAEFERRQNVSAFDRSISSVTPEDSILSKLEWSLASESERQFRDALGVARNAKGTLDRAYLKHWAAELGVMDRLDDLLARIDA